MEKEKTAQERRKEIRLGLETPLSFRFQIKSNKGTFKLQPKKTFRAGNMSLGGISIELPPMKQKQLERIINGEDQLVLELTVPNIKHPLRLTGKIAWLHTKHNADKPIYVAGLSFEDLNTMEREKLLLQLIGICLKSSVKI